VIVIVIVRVHTEYFHMCSCHEIVCEHCFCVAVRVGVRVRVRVRVTGPWVFKITLTLTPILTCVAVRAHGPIGGS
jgi:hypothetical protein